MRMPLVPRWSIAFLLVCGLAAPARAETVRLKDGKALDVEAVEFLDDRIQVTLLRDGGTARVLLRFEQLDPHDILPLWDRTHRPEDASAVLASAEVALRIGDLPQAANRFEVAARLDAAFIPQRDAGFARIRRVEADAAVRDLEGRVRDGRDLRGALTLAQTLLDGPQAERLPAKQRRRIEALAILAGKLVAREVERSQEEESALDGSTPPAPPSEPSPDAPAPAADDGAALPPGGAALAAIRHRIGAFAHRADLAREAAAAVTITNRQSIRHLETAADAYLLARRLVRDAPADLQGALGGVADDLRQALAITYLDLADLYRQEGRFEEARARVRAALILDPGNEQAWEQRRLIEDDIRNPPLPLEAERRPAVEFYYWSPSPYHVAPYWGHPRTVPHAHYRRAVPYRGGLYVGTRFGFGRGHHHHGGARRAVGSRR